MTKRTSRVDSSARDGFAHVSGLGSGQPRLSLPRAARNYWADETTRRGRLAATRSLLRLLWEFARDSTPARLRQRYGDVDYDWDHRVNTTSAAVGWRDRLLGAFHSPYQPTEPELFHEILAALREQLTQNRLDFPQFTFLDLGSGKGRTLLMASHCPFQRIIGVELLPALDQIARQNLKQYNSDEQKCFVLEAICGDATTFALPDEPLVIYLFNPFPESGLQRFAANLTESLRAHPRPIYLLYHNPLLEHVLERVPLQKVAGTQQYSVFRNMRQSCAKSEKLRLDRIAKSVRNRLGRTGSPPHNKRNYRQQELRSLFFENDFSFLHRHFFFAVGARHVAQRRLLGDRAKLPQGALAMREGVGVGASADQRLFRAHVVLDGVLRMIGDGSGGKRWRLLSPRRLAESRRGQQNKQRDQCDFHSLWLAPSRVHAMSIPT
jgi:hypothetical protein